MWTALNLGGAGELVRIPIESGSQRRAIRVKFDNYRARMDGLPLNKMGSVAADSAMYIIRCSRDFRSGRARITRCMHFVL